jgi:uncharacterized protein (TIGR03437 family)
VHKHRVSVPLLAWLVSGTHAVAQVITTIAGTSFTFPSTPLPALNAPLGSGAGLVTDSKGNVFVSDADNNLVLRIALDGTLTIVAGNGTASFSGDGGPAISASLSAPSRIAIDSAGNLFIADTNNNRIRKVSGGIITTVAGTGGNGFSGDGGAATAAMLKAPGGIAFDSAGNLYIADTDNQRIRKVSGGMITTIAGNGVNNLTGDGGTATNASFSGPRGIAVDSAGNVYIADFFNGRIRKVSGGIITTIAGNGGNMLGDGGQATNAALDRPIGIALDSAGNLYIADSGNNRIRKLSGGIITTVAGNGTAGFSGDMGLATSASISFPKGVAVDSNGNIYIGDALNERIRKVSGGIITTIGGNGLFKVSGDGGPSTSATLESPAGVTVDSSGNIYIADTGNNRIRKVSGGLITTIVGSEAGFSGDGAAAISATLYGPHAIAVDSAGNLYIADSYNSRIRKVSNGSIVTVAGNGVADSTGDGGLATNAAIKSPVGVAVDSAGNLYITDKDSHRIRKVSNGIITTVAGNGSPGFSGDGGPATNASLNQPYGIAVDSAGSLYIADVNNSRIRKVSGGIITTVAGNGVAGFAGDGGAATNAALNPSGVAVDSVGNIYSFEIASGRIRKVSGGNITTVAGNGTFGFSGDGGAATKASFGPFPNLLVFGLTSGLAFDSTGNLYIADKGNDRIRKVLAVATSVGFAASLTNLSFSGGAGGALPDSKPVSLTPTVAGLSFTVGSSAPWLSASPTSGTMPTSLQVAVDPKDLTAGTYQGTITITAPNAIPPTVSVAVTFTVQQGTPPTLSLDTPPPNFSLSFSALQGAGSQSLQLHAANSGSGSLAISASASTSTGGAWLNVSPSSGTATPSFPVILNVTANLGSLAPGTYSGSIVVIGGGTTIAVPVTLLVEAPNNVILLSQTGLSFRSLAQGGTPLSQTLGILNTGQGSMSWSATSTTLSGGPWLGITPASGTVNQPFVDVSPVTVAVNAAGLAPGDYYGQIQVTAKAVNSPQAVTVVLTVAPPGTSVGAEIQPTGLIFTSTAGVTPGSQDVQIGNPKAQTDNYLSSSIGTSFSFQPTNAQVLPSQPSTIHVYPDFSQLQPGTIQHGTITLQFADGTPRNISILTVVAPNGVSGTSAHDRNAEIDATIACSPLLVHPTTLTDSAAHVSVGQAVHLAARVVDNCGNAVTNSGGSVTAQFSNGDSPVTLVHIGNGNWSSTWTPQDASQPQVTIQINAFYALGTQALSGVANVSVSAQTASVPVTFSAANAASGAGTAISPGGLVSIYGLQLANAPSQPTTVPFPTTIDGTQVLIGGKPLPLRYVSGGQVNAQVPFDLPINSTQQLVVMSGATRVSVPRNLIVAAADPAVYTQDGTGTGTGIIVDATNHLLTDANPPTEGDVIVVYANALGAVAPPLPTGIPAPSDGTLTRTSNPVTATIGGMPATVNFAGLVPGYPDLYQVNVIVPCHSQSNVPLTLSVAGRTSPTITLLKPRPPPGPPAGTTFECVQQR